MPALLGGTVLAGPASASSGFTTHITPNNTLGLLLDVQGGSTQPGAPVIDWYANGGANQEWTFSTTGASMGIWVRTYCQTARQPATRIPSSRA